jgi:hypothetical protein
MNTHESAFVESFISKARRERALELLASSKNRHKFTSKFDHHGRGYFIPECIRSIEPRHQHPPNITDILRAMGAPDTFHVIGGEHDGKDMELLIALKQIVGYGTGNRAFMHSGEVGLLRGRDSRTVPARSDVRGCECNRRNSIYRVALRECLRYPEFLR